MKYSYIGIISNITVNYSWKNLKKKLRDKDEDFRCTYIKALVEYCISKK